MFNDTTTNVIDEASMTIDTIKKKIVDFQNSSNWNYLLIGTAFLTLVVAIHNIGKYYSEMKKLQSQIGE
jgi:hypothetical protein